MCAVTDLPRGRIPARIGFDGNPDELAPDARMEFKVMASDRGRKAFAAHLMRQSLLKSAEKHGWADT